MSRPHSTVWLLARCFLPSWTVFLVGGTLPLLVIALVIVAISVNIGTILPDVLDGTLALTYTNNVVQPLVTVGSTPLVGNALVVVVWGTLGVALYTVTEFIVHGIRNLRESGHDVQFVDGKIIPHPLLGQTFGLLVWRLVIGMAAAAAVIWLQPLLSRALELESIVLGNLTPFQVFQKLGFSWLVLAGTGYGVVVFLRLYLLRTRLFGDERLY